MVVVLKPAAKRARMPAQVLADGQRRVILVGICGPSGSGKTTLAQELVKSLGTPLGSICADHFYDHSKAPIQKWKDGKSKRTKKGKNLEIPEVIDSECLLSELHRLGDLLADESWLPDKVTLETPLDAAINLTKRGYQRPGSRLGSDPIVLIVEGFLLFHNEEIAQACTHRLWLDIDCDVAMQRRFQREGDKESEMDECWERWYRESVWYNYETYCSLQQDNANQLEPGVFHIDASRSHEEMVNQAMTYLEPHLKSGGICQARKKVVLLSKKRLVDDSRERYEDDSRERYQDDSRERYEDDRGRKRRSSDKTREHRKYARGSEDDKEARGKAGHRDQKRASYRY